MSGGLRAVPMVTCPDSFHRLGDVHAVLVG